MRVSLFNGIPTFVGYLMPDISGKGLQWYFLTHNWENKAAHNFPKKINPKVNITKRLEFKFAYNDVIVQYVSHYED